MLKLLLVLLVGFNNLFATVVNTDKESECVFKTDGIKLFFRGFFTKLADESPSPELLLDETEKTLAFDKARESFKNAKEKVWIEEDNNTVTVERYILSPLESMIWNLRINTSDPMSVEDFIGASMYMNGQPVRVQELELIVRAKFKKYLESLGIEMNKDWWGYEDRVPKIRVILRNVSSMMERLSLSSKIQGKVVSFLRSRIINDSNVNTNNLFYYKRVAHIIIDNWFEQSNAYSRKLHDSIINIFSNCLNFSEIMKVLVFAKNAAEIFNLIKGDINTYEDIYQFLLTGYSASHTLEIRRIMNFFRSELQKAPRLSENTDGNTP